MRSAPRKLGLALVALALVSSLARPSAADDVADEADLQFRLAARKYETADYQGALEHFLASNRLVPNKNVVFNIARTYEQLKQPADAYRYYQRALEGETDAGAQKRIQEALARIRPLVSVVRVVSSPPGATVYLDRKDLGARGQTPLVLAVPAGKYTFLGELAGHESGKAEAVELRQGSETEVRIPLVPIYGTLVLGGEAGAEVRDGVDATSVLCTIPCSVKVPVGKHVLRITKTGFEPSDTVVDVAANSTVQVRPRLDAVYGTLLVASDVRDALVTVDGKAEGYTPAVLTLPVGEHEVKVTKFGYEPHNRKVLLKKGAQTQVEAELVQANEVAAASRSLESAESAPASVTIISGAELRAMGYPTIAEAVRGIRGMYVSDDGSYETVGVRGFSRPGDYGNRVLVTIDGQPTNDNYAGSSLVGFDGRVDLDDVERIEIVRGPGSVVYGTGAFFGVINLVTRSRQVRTHAELAGGTALNGAGRARATAVLRLAEDAGVWTSVALARGAGRDYFFPEYRADVTSPNPQLDASGQASTGVVRDSDGFSAGTLSGRAWWRSLTVQTFYTTRAKAFPTGGFESTPGDPRSKLRDTRGFVELRFEPKLGQTVESLTRVHGNIYRFYGTYGAEPPTGLSTEYFIGRWLGGEQRFVIKPTDSLKLTVGAEVIGHLHARQTSADATAVYTDRNDPFANVAGYLVGDVLPVKGVKISAGARFDYYSNVKLDAVGSTNPRLALLFDTWKGGKIKVLGGKAFRSPSIYELHSSGTDRLPAAELKPEQVVSGELEVSHRFTPTVVGIVAGYTNYVSNLIELKSVGVDQIRYENSSAPVLVVGGEAEVRRDFLQGFMAGATVSVQKAQYLDAPELRTVPNSPYVLGSLKGAAPIVGKSLMAMARVSVEGPRFDTFTGTTDVEPQLQSRFGVVGDLVFSGEIDKLSARYTVGVYNVADSRYEAAPSREYRQRFFLMNGRTFLANVAVSF